MTTLAKVPDNETVSWSNGNFGGAAASAKLMRQAYRKAHPDWTDEEIEELLWKMVPSKGEA